MLNPKILIALNLTKADEIEEIHNPKAQHIKTDTILNINYIVPDQSQHLQMH